MRTAALAVVTLALALVQGSPAAAPPDLRPGVVRATAPAAGSPAEAPVPPAHARPALVVKIADDRPSETLAVVRMDVAVAISGLLAETTTTLTFRNSYGRALEGELVFPLPEGATLSGYALDVAGELVDGVAVERHEARIAFEKEVRKGIDPGLAEWVQGNNFRTRIFPIPAQGTRTVRVRYVSRLLTGGATGARDAFYLLPLATRDRLGELSLRIEVARSQDRPQIRSGGLANFEFGPWHDRYVAQTRLRDFQPEQDLVLALPRVPEQAVTLETAEDGQVYFVIDGFPEAVPAPVPQRARRVGLFWDASLSRENAARERELRAIELWLQRASDLEVDVVVFRDTAEAARRFSVRAGDASALVAFLRGTPCDGGTRLAALRFPADHDYELLVSDGLENLADELPAPRSAVYVLNGDARANHVLLDHIARNSGGSYLNLQQTTVEDAAAAIGAPVLSLLSAEYDHTQLTDISPSGQAAVRDRFTLTGRLLAEEAAITLRFGVGAPSETRAFVLRKSEAVPGRLAAQLWAEQRVAELSVFPERHHDELLALGRAFGMVTPGSSLLVLESLEQYVQHKIEPPKSRPQIREAYLRRMAAGEQELRQKRQGKLESVVAMWQARLDWWRREFPRDVPSRVKQQRDRRAGEETEDLGVEGGVAGGVEGGVPGGVVGGVVGGVTPQAPMRSRLPEPPPPPAPRAAAPATRNEAAQFAAPVGSLAAVAVPEEARAERQLRKEKGGGESSTPDASEATIVIRPWDPDMPYLRALRAAAPGAAYPVFLAQRVQFGRSPAFFLDCADFFLSQGQRALAVRVLTDVVELQLAEPRLLRIAAHRLEQIGELDLAVTLFEAVLKLRPEEPQSLRDLALAIGLRADARRKQAGHGTPVIATEYRRALELLDRIVMGEWDGRFPEIEVIALEEANRMIAILRRDPGFGTVALPIDARLRTPIDFDLRVVLTWDTDLTDMDLWVVEPSGEKCYYSHALTTIGGAITRDFTQGYGPEEYAVRRALVGAYKVQANYYGSRAQSLTGPTTVQATVITDFGRPGEKRQSLTLRLTEAKEIVDVGEVRVGPAPAKISR
jgi:Ca-activated chloride channel homolog